METGCGVVPINYDDKNAVHALQWAIGLEWFLRVDDPWQVALSTDHPNGGSFLAYPQIIALLMDRGLRARHARPAPGEGPEPLPARRPAARILAVGDRHHHPGRRRRGCSGWRPRATSAPGPTPTSRSTPRRRQGPDVLPCPATSSRAARSSSTTASSGQAARGRTAPRRARTDDADVEAEIAEWFDGGSSIRFANYAVRRRGASRRRPAGEASAGWRSMNATSRSSTPSPRRSR